MHAEDFVFYESCEGQIVKDISAISPNVKRTVFSETLIIEPIHLCNLPALMISSDQCNPIWVSHLLHMNFKR